MHSVMAPRKEYLFRITALCGAESSESVLHIASFGAEYNVARDSADDVIRLHSAWLFFLVAMIGSSNKQ